MEIIDQLLAFVQEAAKVLHLDASHSALRDNIQRQLASNHRVNNPDSGYYDYPTVHDVYGDNESGEVVHSKAGQLTKSKFKRMSDNSYAISDHKPVKKAYVAESLLSQESEVQESISIQEAALDANGRGEICLIKPCRGSMGFYTAESLKRTAAKGVFAKDTKMFIDHQTPKERKARPENSVLKQAAVLEGKAVWKEDGKEGPALYAPIKAYSDFVPFINERAKDIGVSVRGNIVPTGKIVDGVPEVQEFASALSVDFVTKAGAGGKLITVYESFRQQNGDDGHRPEIKQEGVVDMEINESDFKALQNAAGLVPRLVTRLDRVEEENRRYKVRDIASGLIGKCGLSATAQTRILRPFISEGYNPPVKDDKLDVTVLEAAVKTAIDEERAYLQESGVLRPSPVSKMGAQGTETTEPTELEISQEADRILSDAARSLSGLPIQEAKTA